MCTLVSLSGTTSKAQESYYGTSQDLNAFAANYKRRPLQEQRAGSLRLRQGGGEDVGVVVPVPTVKAQANLYLMLFLFLLLNAY